MRRKSTQPKASSSKLHYDGARGHAGNAQPASPHQSLALEQRFMFDAAGVTTGVEGLAENVAEQQAAEVVAPPNRVAEAMDSELSKALADLAGTPSVEAVIFVDVSVENYESILDGLDPDAEVVLLEAGNDGVQQIADVLSQHQDLNAIHIISHGSAGELHLGNATLSADSISGLHRDALATIGNAFSENGDILIYGCNFGEGPLGERTVAQLADATQADVAASDDLTGNAALGGDWTLEYEVGHIDTLAYAIEHYEGTLDLAVTSATSDAAVTTIFNNVLVGTGITASSVTQIGSFDQFGTFSNDSDGLGRSVLELDDGLVIVTGDADSAASPAGNTVGGISTTSAANQTDTDLQTLSGNTIFDAAGFDFDFNAATDRIGFVFSFASDEYPEYVGTVFNDAFGFFINGGEYTTTTNLAQVSGDGIAVNTINNGVVGSAQTTGNTAPWVSTNTSLFLDNSAGPYLEYDGLTTTLFIE
ncbi:MAG: DUF4347 domain-containing protein, partial [Gammaproteobacteria bacterium]|nr:DUF4347 domain-containing protein [Gammaproteobacteria bacterium]